MDHPKIEVLKKFAQNRLAFRTQDEAAAQAIETHIAGCDQCRLFLQFMNGRRQQRLSNGFERILQSLETKSIRVPKRYRQGKECLDEAVLASYMEGLLDIDQEQEASKHLQRCQHCASIAQNVWEPIGFNRGFNSIIQNVLEPLRAYPAIGRYAFVLLLLVCSFGTVFATAQYFELRTIRAKYRALQKAYTELVNITTDSLRNKVEQQFPRAAFPEKKYAFPEPLPGSDLKSQGDSLLRQLHELLPRLQIVGPENGGKVSDNYLFQWHKPSEQTDWKYGIDQFELTIWPADSEADAKPTLVYTTPDTARLVSLRKLYEPGKWYFWNVKPRNSVVVRESETHKFLFVQ